MAREKKNHGEEWGALVADVKNILKKMEHLPGQCVQHEERLHQLRIEVNDIHKKFWWGIGVIFTSLASGFITLWMELGKRLVH